MSLRRRRSSSLTALFQRVSGGSSHFELEAIEAIRWLRAAGFPQYAQMFEDGQFPVELGLVERDHDFLDKDSIRSLFRRLDTLNKYAGMHIDAHQRKKAASEEEDDDDICALSERWEYQKSARRWSRKDLNFGPDEQAGSETGDLVRGASHDSLLEDQESVSQFGDSPLLAPKMPHQGDTIRGPTAFQDQTVPPGYGLSQQGRYVQPQSFNNNNNNNNKNSAGEQQQGQVVFPISPRLRRVASERIKTAKNLWKKMEGFKTKKSKRGPRNISDISGPVVDNTENLQAKLQRLNCVDISPTSRQTPGRGVPLSPSSPNLGSMTQRSGSSSPLSPAGSGSPSGVTGENQPLDSNTAFRARMALGTQSLRARPTFMKVDEDARETNYKSPTTPQQPTPPDASVSQPRQPGTESSLKAFYTANSQLQHTLESAQGARKNSADSSLNEIFLLPLDHQPGRFPRMLPNGYIETEGSASATTGLRVPPKASTEPDRLAVSSESEAKGRKLVNRFSVYDNFPPGEHGKKSKEQTSDLWTVESDGIPNRPSDFVTAMARLGVDVGGDVALGKEGKDKSVSFHSSCDGKTSSSSSSSSSNNQTNSSTAAATDGSRSARQRNVLDSASSSRKSSADKASPYVRSGYTLDWSEKEAPRRSNTDSGSTSASDSSKDTRGSADADVTDSGAQAPDESYDEFDLILKQLYDNINDLAQCMGRDRSESYSPSPKTEVSDDHKTQEATASTTSSSTSHTPTPTSSETNSSSNTTTTTTTNNTATTTARSSGSKKSPSLSRLTIPPPTSSSSSSMGNGTPPTASSDNSSAVAEANLPISPLSPNSVDVSMETDGATTDVDQDNSSSAGEGSNTGESASDQEGGLADFSHDDSLDQIPDVTRERRDSGVGHSLTRAPSDRRRKKIRWYSFQRCHRPDISSRNMQINNLTAGQLVRLQKLSLLKLTGIMEKCLPVNKSGWNWMMPRFMKRNKTPDFSDKNVFGVPLSVMAQRTGQPLPQCVLYAMRYLRRTSTNAVGIFRKSGVKSKIQMLRDHLENNPDTTDFDDVSPYNVADMVKTYFRDLPECLLTNKLSETFRSIYTHVPENQRLEAIQAAILLLPDENREVLQSILLFLSDISQHEADHQMNASNLAVCFTPTMFMLGTRNPVSHSPKRNRKNMAGIPDPREIMEQKAAHECFLLMIKECKKLFTVPTKLFRQLQVQSVVSMEATPLQGFCIHDENVTSEVRAFGQERVQIVLKEAHDKNRSWVPALNLNGVEISHRKPMDDCPLKEWKLIVEIDAPPSEVLRRIMHERHTWDEDLLSWSVVERLDPHSDIFQYVLNSMAPHPSRHFSVLRYWRSDLSKGACALVTMSMEHTAIKDEVQGVRALDMGSYFLMEPCGSGRSRLIHITKMDTRGRTPEWYTKIFGNLTGNFIERLRDSFKQEASGGPETKV